MHYCETFRHHWVHISISIWYGWIIIILQWGHSNVEHLPFMCIFSMIIQWELLIKTKGLAFLQRKNAEPFAYKKRPCWVIIKKKLIEKISSVHCSSVFALSNVWVFSFKNTTGLLTHISFDKYFPLTVHALCHIYLQEALSVYGKNWNKGLQGRNRHLCSNVYTCQCCWQTVNIEQLLNKLTFHRQV